MAEVSADIRADKITSPFQLLAACLILLMVVEAAFLSGAAAITRPSWAAALLVISAVVNVPVILFFLFIMQTKYRVELLADVEYAKLRTTLSTQTSRLETQLQRAGFDLENVESSVPLTADQSQNIDRALEKVLASIPKLEKDAETPIPPSALLHTAKGLLARRRWLEAAHYLDEYVSSVPDDWEVQFSRALAHANSRAGGSADLAAFRAYSEAIALAPGDLDPDMRAKLYAYRGAMAKRLMRLTEAEGDLLTAEKFAVSEDRMRDVDYNLAGIYALMGKRDEALSRLRRLGTSPLLRAVRAHKSDYFASLSGDPEFDALLNNFV